MGRAVTAADYEALALDFPGVGKVRAEATNWNTVTLHVAPEGGDSVSDVLLAGLRRYFEDKRPLSTIVDPVVAHTYIPVLVTAQSACCLLLELGRRAPGRSAAGAAARVRQRRLRPARLPKPLLRGDRGDRRGQVREHLRVRRFDKPADPDDPHVTVERTGVLEIGPDEIPAPPDDKGYEGGIKVIVEEAVLMRLLDLVATPHPAGNRIDVSWKPPDGFDGVSVVRREGDATPRPGGPTAWR